MDNKNYNFSVLIFNIQSKHNVKSIINTALSFNCDKILIIGKDKKILHQYYSNENNQNIINDKFIIFNNLEDLKEYIKKNNIFVCGVEIGKDCIPIQKEPFKGNTLFVLGNEGMGLNKKQKELCQQYVFIEQYSNKTGSLNVSIAASIIFYHFFNWKIGIKVLNK